VIEIARECPTTELTVVYEGIGFFESRTIDEELATPSISTDTKDRFKNDENNNWDQSGCEDTKQPFPPP
jgi:hypothetical protein